MGLIGGQRFINVEGKPLYREHLDIYIHKPGEFYSGRQKRVIKKYHLVELPCGIITLDLNARCSEVQDDGKPVYQFVHNKVYIHLRDGLKPMADGRVAGRMEINCRVVYKYDPVTVSEFREMNYRRLAALAKDPDIEAKLERKALDALSKEEFLALPDEIFNEAADDQYLSINIFPDATSARVTHEVKLAKIELDDTRGRPSLHAQEDAIKALKAKHARQSNSTAQFLGPDHNLSCAVIYLK